MAVVTTAAGLLEQEDRGKAQHRSIQTNSRELTIFFIGISPFL
jgi:hypothetical protein